MYTLTLVGQKWDVGKTTLAINLSLAAEAAGLRALQDVVHGPVARWREGAPHGIGGI